MPIVYDLTPITRGAQAERRWVVGGADVNKADFFVAMAAAVPAAILTGICLSWLRFGWFSLLAFVVVELLAFWAFRGRTRKGMKIKNYQASLDQKRVKNGQVYICGRPVDVLDNRIKVIRRATIPVKQPEAAPLWEV